MALLSESDWSALTDLKAGEPLKSKTKIDRFLDLQLLTITPKGEVRLTGLASEILTAHRHGLVSGAEAYLQQAMGNSGANVVDTEAPEIDDSATASDAEVEAAAEEIGPAEMPTPSKRVRKKTKRTD